ncbi:type VI secretion protein [Rhodanobacter glycinis]|uniref:Type VI secretion protein n=1 Tax=Rhodanobacter glycinis TaxID=582702 RepID=A0A502FD61_9GAMM|nr:type IV secretion system protein [Rhodanobacter glycinis]TPG11786.1 type VI secretion protein [Rhodanobacter glycinis]TPG47360.1 type VI secretion protein [Rhodanobacter glycinis]
MVYFVLIYNWLHSRIDSFGANLMGAVTSWMTAIALLLVTIWIMIQGYRLITGQSRESMMGLVTNMVRVVVIVAIATTVGAVGHNLHTLVTTELTTDINQLFTGDDTTLAQTIDKNLAYTQLAMSAIDTVQVPPGDTESASSKARAQAFATFGTASPAMAAAAMLLLYEITLALVIGLAPLFIMCLIFEQTKGLFQKWLLYGIGTLFSMGVLAFISSLVLQLTLKVAEALWAANIINGITGMGAEGFTNQSMQQGGIGLLMTVLIVSSPPLAAMFFQGTVGNFMHFSAFGGGMASRPGPQGQPPGSYGGYGGGAYAPPPSGTAQTTDPGGQARPNGFGNKPGAATRLPGAPSSAYADIIRPAPTPTGGAR